MLGVYMLTSVISSCIDPFIHIYMILSLSFFMAFALKMILSHMGNAILTFLSFPFAWNTFSIL